MIAHRIDADYAQDFLLPPSVEDWVGPCHPARFMREFVETLDLESLGIEWASGEGGRPAYAPELLLKAWLYGYFEGIRSSRKLERACRDHLGFIWLMGMERPDHNTFNGFFRRNKKAIRLLFRKTVEVAAQADLVGFVLQAVDGTKIQAAVANRSGWHEAALCTLLAKLDARIAELEMDIEHAAHTDAPSDELPEALGTRQTLRETVRAALETLEQAGEKHLHPADEDARVMPCKDRNMNTFGYNAQAVADDKTGIVVACEAVQECNDAQQLNAMIDRAEDVTGRAAQCTVADTGYATGSELAHAEHAGRNVVVSLPQSLRPNPDKPFHASNFTYDAEQDCCHCPKDGLLTYRHTRQHKSKGYELRLYRCTVQDCPYQHQCTKDKKGRAIELNQYYEPVQRQRDKHQDPKAQAALAKRSYLIEPVFAYIKQHLGFRLFTVSGLDNVQDQWALMFTTYNLHKLYKHWKQGHLPLAHPPRGTANYAPSTQYTLTPRIFVKQTRQDIRTRCFGQPTLKIAIT